ncbi:ATP-binding protein [Bacillota bacterium Lsc_1132]
MKFLRNKLGNLKIKWKLALWASLLLVLLFLTYNVIQFLTMNNWMVRYEQQSLQKNLQDIQAYFRDKEGELFQDSNPYLKQINEKYQLIRILNDRGQVIMSVSNDLPTKWIKPQPVSIEQVELTKHGEDRVLILRSPITDGQFVGTIEIARSLSTFEGLVDQFFFVMVVTGIGAIILSFFGGLLISKQLLTPVKEMSTTVNRIKKHGLKERVQVKENHDEISELAIHFNELMDQIEKSFNQQRQFIEDASHELRTPLSIIKGHLSMVDRWGKDDPKVLEKSLKSSLREVDRLTVLVKELLELSRMDEDHNNTDDIEKVNVVPLIENVAKNFQMINEDYKIVFEHELPACSEILLNKRQFEQLLVILLDNAVKYSKENKMVEIHCSKTQKNLRMEVKDYGIGIPHEELPFVFDRFYRVDKSRNRKQGGHGIGLSIAKQIVERFNGTIAIDSKRGEWTNVMVQIPYEPAK